jgi:hypothetical protein
VNTISMYLCEEVKHKLTNRRNFNCKENSIQPCHVTSRHVLLEASIMNESKLCPFACHIEKRLVEKIMGIVTAVSIRITGPGIVLKKTVR